jgi:hypothetical protein
MVVKEVEKRGRRKALGRAMEVLEGLWEALGIPQPPPLEVAEALVERGREVVVRPSLTENGAVVEGDALSLYLRFPTRLLTFPRVRLVGDARGDVEVEAEKIFARRGKVFYTAFHVSEVQKRIEVARAFRPLFEALGLGDLGDALEALLGLEDDEVRMEGEHLLVRRGYLLLKRGSLLGEFRLGQGVFHPGEGEASFSRGRGAGPPGRGLR